MDFVEGSEFLGWAAKLGIVPNPAYQAWPDQAPLAYAASPSHWRRWLTPDAPFNLPGFASCLLASAAPNAGVRVWVKGGAPWFTNADPDTGPEWEHLRDRVVGVLPIPRNFSGALCVRVDERDDVVLLMVTFLVFAWCVTDDLQIVPEDGSVILETSHHGDVIVRAPNEERMSGFTALMESRGFLAHEETAPQRS
jgi:hypothetical protein